MYKIQATYFDAISSNPQKVEVSYDTGFSEFRFNPQNQNEIQIPVEEMAFEFIGNTTFIYFGPEPKRTLKINDKDFGSDLKLHLHRSGKISLYQKLIGAGIKTHLLIAAALILFILGLYFTLIPWAAEKAVQIIPLEYDEEMGKVFFKEFARYQKVDEEKSKVLNDFAEKLDLMNDRPIKLFYIRSSEKNAFALPDGTIVIYSAIVRDMNESSELAGLIGHEAAHINGRHSMKMLCRNLAGYLLVSVLVGDVNGVMAVIGDNLHSLQNLSYSRQFEKEADYNSVELMCRNEVDPKGTVQLFSGLQKESDELIPEFMSTHPVTQKRIDYLKKLIREKKCKSVDNPELDRLFDELQKK